MMMYGDWSRGPVIGHGSSATVWLARRLPSGDPFACKSVALASSADLQKEQRFLSALDSPDIITYLGHDVTSEDGSPSYYNLFTEYARGGSLSDHIKKQGGRLDELEIRSRTSEILSGLAYLHAQGVVHCDIKGQNILLGADGRAKIADFGCARWADEDNQIRGTPMFMAPEAARGEEQGPAADVWALGCTVLEMATGGPPWPETSGPITALHRIAFSSDVPEIPSWISEEGKDFLGRCMRRDASERWTVDQLVRHTFSAVKLNSNEDRTTPKSILDQDMWGILDQDTWDVLSEDDDEVQDEVLEDPIAGVTERMHQLATGEPNWTWDECWGTVRSDDSERVIVDSSVEIGIGIEIEDIALQSPDQHDIEDIALITPDIASTSGGTTIFGTHSSEDLEHLPIKPHDYGGSFDYENEIEKTLFACNFSRYRNRIAASKRQNACNCFGFAFCFRCLAFVRCSPAVTMFSADSAYKRQAGYMRHIVYFRGNEVIRTADKFVCSINQDRIYLFRLE